MTVYTKAYKSPAINEKEILRYAGISKANEETQSLLNECLKISKDAFSYKVCYAEFDINCQPDFIDLTFAASDSKDLRKILSDSIFFGFRFT